MKKKKVIVIMLIIIIMIPIISIILRKSEKVQTYIFVNAMYQMELNKTYVSDFNKYKEDFEAVKDFAIEAEKKYHVSDRKTYSIGVDYIDNKLDVFDCDELETIKLSQKMKTHFLNIIKCFENDGGSCNQIKVNNKQVIFNIEHDYYSLIYARDGKKPTRLGYKSNEFFEEYKIKNLGDNWYSVKGV